ncbi:aminotransferase class V-fold PLP-dependent enzyme [Clostridium senegalense]|uniref:aminotransferase class V-fold PLP-dependent enzyme n=1 Tax=Clostridium senegalense TaxID=1465809 RepID=UPI0002899C43|nr:aminotransferase class V-fold PLP-dependent enzyme [Clostridium senegalense]
MSNNYSPYRDLVVGVNSNIPLLNGKLVKYVNFDNAATTPPLKRVINDIITFCPQYSSIHRGNGYKSQLSTILYEENRRAIGNFFNYDEEYMDVIFVKNCTESINKLAYILMDYKPEKDVILSSVMEHHSNDLPWRKWYNIDYINIDNNGNLLIDDLEKKLNLYEGRVKLVTVTGASNVTGHKTPIYEIAQLAHSYDAKILVDCAQLAPHAPIDLKPFYDLNHIDFIAFSGHKFYAPFGCGALLGPKDIFANCNPDHVGGGTIDFVMHDYIKWADSPDRHEAGTPNVIGALAMVSAVDEFSKLGMKNIESYEKHLTKYATVNMISIPNLIIYGDYLNFNNKVSIIPFNIEGIHHNIVAKALSLEFGIAVRSGCFCAQPYMQRLLHISPEQSRSFIPLPKETYPGTLRVSFGMYNTIEEINVLLYALEKIALNRSYYISKYSNIDSSILIK